MTDIENLHVGSSLESWLDEQGIRQEVTAVAIKEALAWQIAAEMKRQGLAKANMARKMGTSRAQLDRLLDPANGSVTLETLVRAASALGRNLRIEIG